MIASSCFSQLFNFFVWEIVRYNFDLVKKFCMSAVTFLGVVDKCITANTSAFGVGLPKIIFLKSVHFN